MTVPYAFGSATAAIPLSQLDSNFNTPITLGNTAIQLGNTVTTLNNMTLANVTISSGSVTLTSVTVTNANVTSALTLSGLTASTALALDASKNVVSVTNTGTGNNVLAGSPTLSGTVSAAAVTMSSDLTLNGGTANGVGYLNASKVLTTGSALTFDGTNFALSVTGAQSTMRALAGAGQTATLQIAANGNTAGATSLDLVQDSSSNGYLFQRANAPLIFGVNNAEQMRLTSTSLYTASGVDVGIGTSSPAAKLDVSGQIITRGSVGALIVEPRDGSGASWSFYNPTGDDLRFYGNSDDRLILTNAGNLGLGVTPSAVTSPYYSSFELGKAGSGISASTASLTSLENTWVTSNAYPTYSAGTVWKYANDGPAARYGLENGQHAWYIATSGSTGGTIAGGGTQAMTLDASGNLLVGKTAVTLASNGFVAQPNGYASCSLAGTTNATDTLNVYSTGATAYRFYVDMAGTIHATSTSITAISDQSLKTNIKPLETGLAEVMALQPRRYDWINGDGENKAGFIAQEVEQVLPDLVAPFKYNDDEIKLGLKMGDMIPTLVKAIQELKAEVDSLKAQLKGA